MKRVLRPWSAAEEAKLLLATTLSARGACVAFAEASGRSQSSVRVKLCRLLKDPLNRAPTFEGALATYRAAEPRHDLSAPARDTDAAAPRVQPARGPGSTPDSKD